jgi:hypothetical protein
VVGPQELADGTVGLRPLRTDEEQRAVPRAAIVDELRAYLAAHDVPGPDPDPDAPDRP